MQVSASHVSYSLGSSYFFSYFIDQLCKKNIFYSSISLPIRLVTEVSFKDLNGTCKLI